MNGAPDLDALDAIPRELLPAAIARLAARAMEPVPTPDPAAPTENGDLLTADDVAKRLHVSRRWAYRHADDLHAVRLSEAKVRFTAAGIDKYLRKKGRP
ncbi:MAG TPA: helix-turn-helix domain-containing protein [Gemmatimonadales bacterium]|nr:helix-turn-helix domain-containing protein [Gemmatimonadales bacterium]